MLPILEDCFFAATAAIGFGSISNVPVKTFTGCAVLAAAGHGTRTLLTGQFGTDIIPASFIGSIAIGLLSIPASSHWKTPAESMSFPALLPMIPGMYAYRSMQALIACVHHSSETDFMHQLYLLHRNGLVCCTIILLMFLGVTVPIFCFKKHSFSATR
ncbi:MAG: threonine/serine exporter family protein [Bacteroidales bacterium]|nr:threonine/serine exporter family protein [Bacteroidales bacterium]MCM1147762.1 threonine/serine exporter family protein [Bacteroidales bacterium]MCM1206628.1 threonine/serine exporter family protein [Bacillota bacterium]MCM1510631.1 threonine/serine exporter family protein [Clostridium sp.]